MLRHSGKRLQIILNNSIRKMASFFPGVTFRHIYYIRLYHDGCWLSIELKIMQSRYGMVIAKTMLSPNNLEAQYVPLVVKNLEPFCAAGCRQSRHHTHFSGAAHLAISSHGAATNEMLVGLRIVEPADYRPDYFRWSMDPLHHHRAALVLGDDVSVVAPYQIMDVGEFFAVELLKTWGYDAGSVVSESG